MLGLLGGLLFEVLSDVLGISTQDPAYAALALPIYMLLTTANLVMAVVGHPHIPREAWGRTIKEAGIPALPLELVDAVLAATAVLLWIRGGVDAAVGLLAVLVIVIPLTRSLMDGLRSSDDLVAVSDARAVEVERLAADRERLLEEVLNTEERERARLCSG